MKASLGLVLACGLGSAAAHAASISDGQITRPEGERHYLLVRPATAAAGKLPLVIRIHGHMGSAAQELGRNGKTWPGEAWIGIADREHVLVVAPDGVKGGDGQSGWNDCRADAESNPKADDVGFMRALIERAIKEWNADPERIYVTGMSNGGGMAYRMAIEMAPQIAAISVESGVFPAEGKSLCAAPAVAMPMLVTHGTADPIVPYAGGKVGNWMMRAGKARGQAMPVEDLMRMWARVDGMPDVATDAAVTHRRQDDPTRMTRFSWGKDLVFLKVEKGGHVPPSIAYRIGAPMRMLLGRQNADVEMAEEAWRFFRDRRRIK